jgi:hypothetical protein
MFHKNEGILQNEEYQNMLENWTDLFMGMGTNNEVLGRYNKHLIIFLFIICSVKIKCKTVKGI